MGVGPYTFGSTVNAIKAQRLVREICTPCAEDDQPSYALLKESGITPKIAELMKFKISKGCGPYVDREFYGYSFLNPYIIDIDAPKSPYFAGFEKLYKQLKPTEDIQQKDNLTEWSERFCNIPKLLDINFIVYKA